MTGFIAFAGRVLSEKRGATLLVASALAIDAGLYAFAVYPSVIRVANAERRAAAAVVDLENSRQRLATVRATADGKIRADESLQTFHHDILPADLASARAITFPRLAALADANNLVLERRGAALPDPEADGRLARLRVSMLLKGDYRDMRQFIHELETAPEFLVIEEIALSQGNETDSAEVLTIGLATFYRDNGETGDEP